MIEDMGHDLPDQAWPQLIDAIAEHAARRRAHPPGRARHPELMSYETVIWEQTGGSARSP